MTEFCIHFRHLRCAQPYRHKRHQRVQQPQVDLQAGPEYVATGGLGGLIIRKLEIMHD